MVDGYSVPAGTTSIDYRDTFFAAALGSVDVPAPRSTSRAGRRDGVRHGDRPAGSGRRAQPAWHDGRAQRDGGDHRHRTGGRGVAHGLTQARRGGPAGQPSGGASAVPGAQQVRRCPGPVTTTRPPRRARQCAAAAQCACQARIVGSPGGAGRRARSAQTPTMHATTAAGAPAARRGSWPSARGSRRGPGRPGCGSPWPAAGCPATARRGRPRPSRAAPPRRRGCRTLSARASQCTRRSPARDLARQ